MCKDCHKYLGKSLFFYCTFLVTCVFYGFCGSYCWHSSVNIMQRTLWRWCITLWILRNFFNRINSLFMFYDEVSSVKWSTSGVIDNGLGKSFLGSTSWSQQASMSKQVRITWLLSWYFLVPYEKDQSLPFSNYYYKKA